MDSGTIRSYAALLTAVAAVATAFLKPQDHSVAKAGYGELSKAVDELSAQTKANHDDLVALRGYVAAKDGELLMPRPVVLSQADAGVGASLGAGGGAGVARAPEALVRPSPSSPAVILEPPPVHSAPAAVHPAEFDSILRGAK